MKKIICLLLSAILLVSLAACTSAPNSSEIQIEEKSSVTESESMATEQKEDSVEEGSNEEIVEEETDTAFNQSEVPADYAPDITFSTVDRDGNEWTEKAFAGQNSP